MKRADNFKIHGVTEMLVMGVAKNIIPAIASTNALIASTLTNEVFKILTGCAPKVTINIFSFKIIFYIEEESLLVVTLSKIRKNKHANLVKWDKID